jgi:hypothetical protein
LEDKIAQMVKMEKDKMNEAIIIQQQKDQLSKMQQ